MMRSRSGSCEEMHEEDIQQKIYNGLANKVLVDSQISLKGLTLLLKWTRSCNYIGNKSVIPAPLPMP